MLTDHIDQALNAIDAIIEPSHTNLPINQTPRSLGGDLNVSRRCFGKMHLKCMGTWTAYPDSTAKTLPAVTSQTKLWKVTKDS